LASEDVKHQPHETAGEDQDNPDKTGEPTMALQNRDDYLNTLQYWKQREEESLYKAELDTEAEELIFRKQRKKREQKRRRENISFLIFSNTLAAGIVIAFLAIDETDTLTRRINAAKAELGKTWTPGTETTTRTATNIKPIEPKLRLNPPALSKCPRLVFK
jgi:hypothetical protein